MFAASLRKWPLLVVLWTACLSGCGGVDTCECLKEAGKENPDQALMDKCREAFSKMEMDEVQKAVEKCGK